ncbi:MAG: hypothetical protein P1P65_06355 [Treponema sp.]
MKTLFIFLYAAAVSFVFAGEKVYSADIRAVSNGKEKTIYAKVNKQKTENKIMLVVSGLDSGSIEIRSDKFKLGKMPFSSSFQFIIPETSDITSSSEILSINGITGTYSVAGSKTSAQLSGKISRSFADLHLETSGMGKKLTLHITYAE